MATIWEHTKELIKINKYKGIVGCVLALAALVLCALNYSLIAGLVFAVAFVVLGFFELNIQSKKVSYILNILYTLFCVVFIFFIACKLMYPLSFPALTFWIFLLNVLCVAIVCGVFYIITANVRISISISAALLMILSVANYFVFVFRDREFVPADIFSAGTAMNVAGQYTLSLPPLQGYFLIVLALCIFAQFSLPKWPAVSKIRTRIIMTVTEVVMIIVLLISSVNIPFRVWQSDGSNYNGYYLNFFLGIQSAKVDKPKGYSSEAVEKQSDKYRTASTEGQTETLPNIIIIMDESYADFGIFGSEVSANQAITPYIDSLKENVIQGYALTSVYGGNTANAEFEILTGHSMAFLPEMSVPYQQYMGNPIGSLVWFAENNGYSTFATHPFNESGWNRTWAYPKLGFEKSTFVDDYKREDLMRGFVSDKEMFEYVCNALENKDKSSPMLLFGITMQNHGGYAYQGDDFTQSISLEGYSGDYPQAEQYLSLINETDKAVEKFLTSLEQYPEDTLVLFFGDHFPKVENEFYEELAGGPLDTLDKQMLQYTVPFFIWANYDIPEDEVELTSLNYLARYLLDAARIDLPPYYQFLAEAEKNIPAMNALGYYSKSQNKFLTYDEATGKEKQWINRYAMVQYNNLFDKKNRDENFFAKYISENS